jgi:hypothetical protein
MPVTDIHICIFCQGKMTVETLGHYCKKCDVCKNNNYYVFERLHKGRTYKFTYDIHDQKFTLTDEDCENWDNYVVMTSDNFYIITPKNWQKKLPTILVFS